MKKTMYSKRVTVIAAFALVAGLMTGCGSAKQTIETESGDASANASVVEVTESGDAEKPSASGNASGDGADLLAEVESGEADSEAENADSKGDKGAYSYIDLTATMYVISTVNVRDLPSTDGEKIGSLSYNQEVAVTGKCKETGWYRIEYKSGVAYVSDKYLTDTRQAESSGEKDESKSGATTSENTIDTSASTSTEAHFDRTMAEAIFNSINAERAAAGETQLTWSEEAYNFACTRAQDIVTDFSHNGCSSAWGENIAYTSSPSASHIQNQFYNSQGHHDNYMDTVYSSGAVAVWIDSNGYGYCAEEFIPASSGSGSGSGTYSNGSYDNTVVSTETWTSSAGHVWTFETHANGSVTGSCPVTGMTNEECKADLDEYFAGH